MSKAAARFERSGPASDPIIKVIGEFDLSGEEPLSNAVEQAVSGARFLTIDMSEVTFIDSTGVECLLSAQSRCIGVGAVMMLVQSAAVERVFRLLGINDTFNRIASDGDLVAP